MTVCGLCINPPPPRREGAVEEAGGGVTFSVPYFFNTSGFTQNSFTLPVSAAIRLSTAQAAMP